MHASISDWISLHLHKKGKNPKMKANAQPFVNLKLIVDSASGFTQCTGYLVHNVNRFRGSKSGNAHQTFSPTVCQNTQLQYEFSLVSSVGSVLRKQGIINFSTLYCYIIQINTYKIKHLCLKNIIKLF